VSGPPRMQCANCQSRVTAYSLRDGNFCPNDRVLLCRRCISKGRVCPSCGSRVSSLPGGVLLQSVLILAVFGILGTVLFAGAYSSLQADGAPITPVGHLAPGSDAKVVGWVSANQSVVITVFQYSSGGNSITGRHVEPFWMNDSTGRVLVEMGSNYSDAVTIGDSGHPYPPTGPPTGFVYASGDAISVYGEVVRVGNLTEIEASGVAVGPSGFSVNPPLFYEAFFAIPLAVGTAGILVGVVLGSSRGRAHLRHVGAWSSRRPAELLPPPPSDPIAWTTNRYAAHVRAVFWGTTAVGIGAAAGFLLFLFAPIDIAPDTGSLVFLSTSILALFGLIFGLSFGSASRKAIVRLGTSPAGLYVDYRKLPRGARTFFAWSDVRELEAPIAANRRTIALGTPFGTDYLLNLDVEMAALVRAQFETARVPYRDPSAPIRPTVGSLLGAGAPAALSPELDRRTNPLRLRSLRYALLFGAVQVPVLIPFVWVTERIGINQGDSLFFFPLIAAVASLTAYRNAPREVGFSSAGFSLYERKGVRTVLFADIAEMTPAPRGFRYKTFTGFAETIPLLDPGLVAEISARLATSRGAAPPRSGLWPPPETAWTPNPVRVWASGLTALFLVLPSVMIAIGVVGLWFEPENVNWFLLAILPIVIFVGALVPYSVRANAPRRIAIASGALYVDWGAASAGPGKLVSTSWSDVAELSTGGADVAVPPRGAGIRSVPVQVLTRGGSRLSVGQLTPESARSIAARLRPDQLTGWKDGAIGRAGRPGSSTAR
jgi:hypothetical protein